MSPALHASNARRMTSTFSCDIVYSDSPATSRDQWLAQIA
jgi:hypothetical protein